MFLGPASMAAERVRPMTACYHVRSASPFVPVAYADGEGTPTLLVLYAAPPGYPRNPATLDVVTMLASLSILCSSALIQLKTPFKFTSMVKSQSSSVESTMLFSRLKTPARFAAPVKGPRCLIVSSSQSPTSLPFLTSRAFAWILTFGTDFWISATAASRGSCRTSASESDAPREARRRAVARAMPEAAPVMAMTLPSKEVMMEDMLWRSVEL